MSTEARPRARGDASGITRESYLRPGVAADVSRRLRAIDGQVRGIMRMVEDGRHCTDIITQLAAVHEALGQTGKMVLRNYLETCATKAIRRSLAPAVYDEIMDILYRFAR